MTQMEKEIEKRGITIYRLTKIIGLDPRSSCSFVGDKVRGFTGVSPEEITKMCKAISDHSKDKLDEKDIKHKIVKCMFV